MLYYSTNMERWAANTLRTLGIILTACFVIVMSLFLALMAMCASSGGFGGSRDQNAAAAYALAAVIVVIAGIAFITWLARGIFRAMREPLPAGEAAVVQVPEISVPLHLSPLGRRAINRLVIALSAQVVVSTGIWVFNQISMFPKTRYYYPSLMHSWIYLIVPFALLHIPYAILIYYLLKRPDRRAFSYSLAVPAVLIMFSLFSLSAFLRYAQSQPAGFLLMFIPWAIHIVIIVFAYQAIQQVGLHPQPSGLIVAAAVSFVFFLFVHSVAPILYRFRF
jgi:hypothetical protein